jgi:hypothetical protein
MHKSNHQQSSWARVRHTLRTGSKETGTWAAGRSHLVTELSGLIQNWFMTDTCHASLILSSCTQVWVFEPSLAGLCPSVTAHTEQVVYGVCTIALPYICVTGRRSARHLHLEHAVTGSL